MAPPTAAPTTPPPPPAPDLSPVAAPSNVAAVGRWASVSGSLKTIEKIGKLPLSLDSLLEKELNDKELFALLKLDSPIDGAVVLSSLSTPDKLKPLGVISLPLRSLDEALAMANRAGKPVTIRPGVHRIGRTRDLVCDISVAVGDVPARLLCAEQEAALDALVPWMTRGLPTESFGNADLHLELRVQNMVATVKQEIEALGPVARNEAEQTLRKEGITHPLLNELIASAAADAPKFASDVDTLALDVRLDGARTSAAIAGSLKFRGNTAWATRLLTHRNEKAGSPPAAFWQLPKDSDSASFSLGSDSKMLDGGRDLLAAGFRAVATGKFDGRDVQTIAELLSKMPVSEARSVVVARGHLPTPRPPKDIKPANFKPADALRLGQNMTRQTVGWSLVGLEAKPDVYVAWLKEAVKAYNTRTFQDKIKKMVPKDSTTSLPTIKVVPAPKGMPTGTFAIQLDLVVHSKAIWDTYSELHGSRVHPKQDVTGPASVLITVSPDGDYTWIGTGSDQAALVEHLNMAKGGASKDSTLSARAGLDALKSGSFTSGGFVAIASGTSIVNGIRATLTESKNREVDEGIAALPNKGETPMLFFTTGTVGNTPVNSAEFRVEKGSIDDLIALGYFLKRPRPEPTPEPAEQPAPKVAPRTPAKKK